MWGKQVMLYFCSFIRHQVIIGDENQLYHFPTLSTWILLTYMNCHDAENEKTTAVQNAIKG